MNNMWLNNMKLFSLFDIYVAKQFLLPTKQGLIFPSLPRTISPKDNSRKQRQDFPLALYTFRLLKMKGNACFEEIQMEQLEKESTFQCEEQNKQAGKRKRLYSTHMQ